MYNSGDYSKITPLVTHLRRVCSVKITSPAMGSLWKKSRHTSCPYLGLETVSAKRYIVPFGSSKKLLAKDTNATVNQGVCP